MIKLDKVKGYKVFNEDWTCRDKQYKLGEAYHENGKIELCEHGMHFCTNWLDCFNYYYPEKGNHICEVLAWGNMDKSDDDSKMATSDLKIVKELEITDDMLLDIVKQDGYAIDYIVNPSEKAQLEAVKQNGYAIDWIDNPSEKVQLEAVKQDGYAIYFIDNPSEEVQLEAVKQNGCAIKYIDNSSEQVKLEAVKESGYAIQFICNPSEEMKSEAIK